ncbi:WD40-repeat-containing domain protein [Fimicolochytrium jonesii]|uniref:WD40-repeat-containing domain protein n=1 Tax=Fimicolochytrium jonesii TaxID=1396493 RepID=UPI0022FED567|nr:WD40-repeat-containing domain protein [Fimicolochytrium jonesii]KAI8827285.1 WD40-repeat-containing domain protein [Fimicolochytrium jonesii]
MSAFGSLGAPVAQKDVEISQPPGDTVSELRFSPRANLLAASSWDNQTRIWEISSNGQSIPKAAIQHEAPALCVDWSADGTKLLSGGCDKAGRMMDITTGQTMQVASHDAPIKSCRFMEFQGSTIAVTGSWDKTLRFWDLRQPTPVHTFPLPERCYAMDAYGPMLVVGTADRNMLIFSTSNLGQPYKVMPPILKWQTRTLACFPSTDQAEMGFCFGSIEGRCQLQWLEDGSKPPPPPQRSFSFRCHRTEKETYAVNSISFHPVYGTFATCGADGTIAFWDKDAKSRLKNFPTVGSAITASSFNFDGTIFSYATGYDWSKGHEEHKQGSKVAIMLHSLNPADIKPKPPGVKLPGKKY